MRWDDELPNYTCPAIDKQIGELNRWSYYAHEDGDGESREVVSLQSAIEALEALRSENEKLRELAELRYEECKERGETLDKIRDLL